jgi:hypothetical protein
VTSLDIVSQPHPRRNQQTVELAVNSHPARPTDLVEENPSISIMRIEAENDRLQRRLWWRILGYFTPPSVLVVAVCMPWSPGALTHRHRRV